MSDLNAAITDLQNAIAFISPDSPADAVVTLRDQLDAVMLAAKECDKLMDDAMYEWITSNGEIVFGSTRYYTGMKSVDKCLDVKATAEGIIQRNGGDFTGMADYLSSQPFKFGACKKLFAAEYDVFFKTELKPEIRKGVPGKSVIKVNTDFVKP